MFRLSSLICFLLISISAYSIDIDSLLFKSVSVPVGENRNATYDEIIDYYYDNDTSKIHGIIDKAESEAVRLQNEKSIYNYRYKRAEYYSFVHKHTKAISVFSSLLDFDLSKNQRAKVYGKIGREYERLYE